MLEMIELFSGSAVMTEAFKRRGYRTFTIDSNSLLSPDYVADITQVAEIIAALNEQGFTRPDVVWASPPCTTFSVASIARNWVQTRDGVKPTTDKCLFNIKLVEATIEIIEALQPRYWFLENPRGMIVRLDCMKPLAAFENLVTYCKYGELERRKPTLIYTNCPIKLRRPCRLGRHVNIEGVAWTVDRNTGRPCHHYVPRGAGGGTQNLSGNYERAKLPHELCQEVASGCTELLEKGAPQIPTLDDYGGQA